MPTSAPKPQLLAWPSGPRVGRGASSSLGPPQLLLSSSPLPAHQPQPHRLSSGAKRTPKQQKRMFSQFWSLEAQGQGSRWAFSSWLTVGRLPHPVN